MFRYINTCSNGLEAIALGGRRLHEDAKRDLAGTARCGFNGAKPD